MCVMSKEAAERLVKSGECRWLSDEENRRPGFEDEYNFSYFLRAFEGFERDKLAAKRSTVELTNSEWRAIYARKKCTHPKKNSVDKRHRKYRLRSTKNRGELKTTPVADWMSMLPDNFLRGD